MSFRFDVRFLCGEMGPSELTGVGLDFRRFLSSRGGKLFVSGVERALEDAGRELETRSRCAKDGNCLLAAAAGGRADVFRALLGEGEGGGLGFGGDLLGLETVLKKEGATVA